MSSRKAMYKQAEIVDRQILSQYNTSNDVLYPGDRTIPSNGYLAHEWELRDCAHKALSTHSSNSEYVYSSAIPESKSRLKKAVHLGRSATYIGQCGDTSS